MKRILSIIIFLSIFSNIFGQSTEFKHFSTDFGLASSEVYCQLQDNYGYMWFGTSRGLSRFDGYEFKNFTASDGLPSNSIIKMFKDRFGRIWFSNYDGSLSLFENEEFKIYNFNDTIIKLSKNYYINSLLVDKDSSLWIMPALGGIYKINTKGEIFDYTPQSNIRCFFFKDEGFGLINTYIYSNTKSDSIYLKVNKNGYYLYGTKNGFRKNVYKIKKGEYLLSIGQDLFYIKDFKIFATKSYSNEISGIFSDNQYNFWISVLYEGIYFYANSNLNKNPERYLFGKSPIQVFQDKQNGYWLSTTENGVYYSPSFQFISYIRYGIPLFNILSLKIFNNTLYFSTYDRQVVKSKLNGHNILSVESMQLRQGRDYSISDITATSDSSIWFLGKELIKYKNDKFDVLDTLPRSYKLYADENKIYTCTSDGMFIFGDKVEFFFYNNFPTSNALFIDKDKNVWIGSINGLFLFKNGKFEYLGKKDKNLKFRINDLTQLDKYIIIATNGNGILFFNPQNNYIKQLEEKDGLNSNFVNTVYSDGKDLWAGTNKGLCRINIITKYDSLQIFTTQFTEVDGLYANEIKDIDKNEDCIFLGTSQGLISFYPDKLEKNKFSPDLHIDSILANNFRVQIDTLVKLPSDKNTITIYYKAISYSAGNKVRYKYQLKGFDDKWVETGERILRFPNLLPGKYNLKLLSSTDGIIWNQAPYEFNFVIRKKFTKTIAFYSLLLILTFIIAFIFLVIRFTNLERDLKQKRKMMRSEQKALRSQMNPHFIFNALNSIRRYILENDSDNADFYLTSFAQLMRKVLENSKHEFIPLEEELETLKLYLELEKMRFDESFDFKLEIDENISLGKIYLPTMIIQPVLENSIWHGLAPLRKNGKLILSILKISEQSFMCVVEDNGIGRQKASEIAEKRKGHKSTGLKNLEERLNLLNESGFIHIELITIDLFNSKGQATGTKVEIKFDFLKKDNKDKKITIKLFGRKYYIKL